jgi:hypothetical protein
MTMSRLLKSWATLQTRKPGFLRIRHRSASTAGIRTQLERIRCFLDLCATVADMFEGRGYGIRTLWENPAGRLFRHPRCQRIHGAKQNAGMAQRFLYS